MAFEFLAGEKRFICSLHMEGIVGKEYEGVRVCVGESERGREK